MDLRIWKEQFQRKLRQQPLLESGKLRWFLGPELPVTPADPLRPCMMRHGTTEHYFVGAKADVEAVYSHMLGNDRYFITLESGRHVWRYRNAQAAKRRFYKIVEWALGERATFTDNLRELAATAARAEAKRILAQAADLAAQGRQRDAIQILTA